MGKKVRHFTKSEWESIPASDKGHVGSAVMYTHGKVGNARRSGNRLGTATTDYAAMRRYTLKSGRRVLFEGIDFTIEGRCARRRDFLLI